MSDWLLLYPIIHSWAWLCSAMYHYRRTPLTTQLDYSSAFVLVAFSSWTAWRKLIGPRAASSSVFFSGALALGFCVGYLGELLRERVSHAEHMAVCIALACTHALLWMLWVARSRSPRRPLCFLCNLLFAGAALFELLDFPPLALTLDAHALWHLLTIPLALLWYKFWALELRDAVL